MAPRRSPRPPRRSPVNPASRRNKVTPNTKERLGLIADEPLHSEPTRPTYGGHKGRRNLRALSVSPVEEVMPQMLPFDSSRVLEGGWSSASGRLYVRFRDGTPWVYEGVQQNEWRNFRRSASPGRYINRVLNGKNYYRGNH